MIQETGFAHFVIVDSYNNEFLLLGSLYLDDTGGDPPVQLETADGQKVSVSKDSFQENYKLSTKIRIAKTWTGVERMLSPLSPVFLSYKGVKAMLIGVAKKSNIPEGRRYAIYQRMDDGEVYSLSLDEFYDTFSLMTEVGVTTSPYILDEKGMVGYVVNREAFNREKYPNMIIDVDAKGRQLTAI